MTIWTWAKHRQCVCWSCCWTLNSRTQETGVFYKDPRLLLVWLYWALMDLPTSLCFQRIIPSLTIPKISLKPMLSWYLKHIHTHTHPHTHVNTHTHKLTRLSIGFVILMRVIKSPVSDDEWPCQLEVTPSVMSRVAGWRIHSTMVSLSAIIKQLLKKAIKKAALWYGIHKG